MYDYKLGVIGAGNMARAIVGKVIESGALAENEIAVSDPFCDNGIGGVVNLKNNELIVTKSEYVLLAVKPQAFQDITELKNTRAKAVVSIMAGIKISVIKSYLPNNIDVVRVMPNTPCQIGMGMSAITDSANADALEFTEKIFKSTGKTAVMKEELFDAVTALSGSGPAYAYMFVDSMIRSGVKLGLDEEQARIMAVATVAGACGMISTSDKEISQLISAVRSKGGTTNEAIIAFENGGLSELVDNAMTACYNRSVELGK